MIRDFFKWTYLFFLDNPITNRSLIAIEIFAYFKQALAIGGIRNQLSLAIFPRALRFALLNYKENLN